MGVPGSTASSQYATLHNEGQRDHNLRNHTKGRTSTESSRDGYRHQVQENQLNEGAKMVFAELGIMLVRNRGIPL